MNLTWSQPCNCPSSHDMIYGLAFWAQRLSEKSCTLCFYGSGALAVKRGGSRTCGTPRTTGSTASSQVAVLEGFSKEFAIISRSWPLADQAEAAPLHLCAGLRGESQVAKECKGYTFTPKKVTKKQTHCRELLVVVCQQAASWKFMRRLREREKRSRRRRSDQFWDFLSYSRLDFTEDQESRRCTPYLAARHGG